MAESIRRGSYDPYRNVHYAYDGSAARELEEEPAVQTHPRTRTRRRELIRPKAEVRPAGKVSLFAVAGFATVIVLAVLLLMNYVQLANISSDVVELNSQMTQLQGEEAALRARYELAYDLGAIESSMTADGSMSRPQSSQMIYVALTEPDSVVVYDRQEETGGFWESVEEIVGSILEYF